MSSRYDGWLSSETKDDALIGDRRSHGAKEAQYRSSARALDSTTSLTGIRGASTAGPAFPLDLSFSQPNEGKIIVSKIVCIHGIRQQLKGEDTLRGEWAASLRDGLRRATPTAHRTPADLTDADIKIVFYGDVFRPPGQTLGVGDPRLTAGDLTDLDHELLSEWWRAAAEVDPAIIQPDERTLVRSPRAVQTALRILSRSAFFVGLTERLMLGDLVQVRRYFAEPRIRSAIQRRVADSTDEDTRVIVGHSLGSIVAYEALCAHPEWAVRGLVTLGSPLGVRNLIFDRLQPKPVEARSPQGCWPGQVEVWTNVADAGDITALVKDLRPLFGRHVFSSIVHNGAKAHDVRPYLTAAETGRGILAGLTDIQASSDL